MAGARGTPTPKRAGQLRVSGPESGSGHYSSPLGSDGIARELPQTLIDSPVVMTNVDASRVLHGFHAF